MKLTLYKRVAGVPIYLYPTPAQIKEIRDEYVSRVGTLKRTRVLMRGEYRCFLSENALWKTRRMGLQLHEYVEPPSEPKLANLVVMGRATNSDCVDEAVSLLRKMGVKPNPYRSRRGRCFGFYVSDMSMLDAVVEKLAERNLVEALMLTNGIWYVKLADKISFAPLIKSKLFIVTTSKSFKYIQTYIEHYSVNLFPTGKARIILALTPEQAKDVAGRLYALLLRHGAIEGDKGAST